MENHTVGRSNRTLTFDGKLWLSQSDIRAALAEPKVPITRDCLYFPKELKHIDAREHYWFFKLELAHHTIRPEPYFTIPAIGYFTRGVGFGKDDNGLHRRINGFEGLLVETQPQPAPLMHPHTCGEEAEILRSILDKHPHWERVMELWNLAEVLKIKVTMVRSAVQHLKKHGFDILSGKRRDYYATSKGRAGKVPKVRLSDPVVGSTVAEHSNVELFHRDP